MNIKKAEQIPNFEKYKWNKKLYFNTGFNNKTLNSIEIIDEKQKFLIKRVLISGQKHVKTGFKTFRLTKFGPSIVSAVKPGIQLFIN